MRSALIPELTLNVSELNAYIGGIVKRDVMLRSVKVRGEIGSFKNHFSSGHWYFTLKDETGSIPCVMYRQNNARNSFIPKDGMKVLISGYVDLYQKTAQIQLNISAMRPDGEGDLWQRMEALKAKLAAEGLLDPARKKTIPRFPKKIAVVTSESGAVWHDIVNVSRQRNPSVAIALIPVSVQGAGAELEIADGIKVAQSIADADVIIVGRGGGSMEDLWCFNEECVARAVAGSRLPVVSAVGHETDYTICDMVADVRASTPSNAAEIIVPTVRELQDGLDGMKKDLTSHLTATVSGDKLKISTLQNRLHRFEPFTRMRDIRGEIRRERILLDHTAEVIIKDKTELLREMRRRLNTAADIGIEQVRNRILRDYEKMNAISPVNVLERGYAIVNTPEGNIITSAVTAKKAQTLKIRFHDGETVIERRNPDERKENI